MSKISLSDSKLQVEWRLFSHLLRVRIACLVGGPLFFAALFGVLQPRNRSEPLLSSLFVGCIFGLVFGYAVERFATLIFHGLIDVLRSRGCETATVVTSALPATNVMEEERSLS